MKKLFTLLTLLVCVCTGAWADPVTIGLTQSVTDEGDTHTVGDPAYIGTTNLTVSKSIGSSCGDGFTGKTVKVGSPEVTYTVTKAFRKTINGTSFNDNQYVGYTFTVASGYKVSLTNLNAEFWSSDATMYWRVVVINNSTSATLYTSSTVQNNSNKKGSISVVSPTGLTNLTEGTYTVKLQMHQSGGNKYFVVPTLTFSATLTADDTPSYAMTATVDNATHGTVEVSPASVKSGGSATFTATSKTGYKFTKWTDTNTGSDISTNNPYIITNVSEAVSLTANFTNAYSISYNVTDGSRGTTTTGLETEYTNDADKFTAPQNYYIFKDGYTLDHWTDGTNDYTPGTEYTLNDNITLQPEFKANTKTLADRTAATTVTWNFNYVGGEAPAISIENLTGYYIKQATIDGVPTDIVMAIDNTIGSAIEGVYGKTVNNYDKKTQSGRTYAQVNRGSKWTIPAVKGMTVVAYSANGNYIAEDDKSDPDEKNWKYATRVGGVVATSGTGTQTATWVYNGEDATIDYVAGNDAGYVSKLVVTYPAPYSVTYDDNGAESGSVTDESTYDKNASVTTKANSFVKTGYAFAGWNTEADGTGTPVAAGDKFSITGNTTLYAQWLEGSEATITYTLNVGTSASTTIKASVSSTDETNINNIDIDETNAGANGSGASDRTTKLAIKTGKNDNDIEDPDNYILFKYTVATDKVFTPTDIKIEVANVGGSSANNIKYKATLSDTNANSISNTYVVTTQDGTVETFHITNSGKVGFTGEVTLKLWAWTIEDKDNGGSAFRMGSPLTISGVVTDKPENITATITNAGWATLYTPWALDFSTLSENLTAYTATLNDNIVTLTKVDNVPAQTGVVLKGAANTYSIPVIASSETPQGDMTGSATSGTHLDANTAYILGINNTTGKAQFFINSAGTIEAGKAYLPAGNTNTNEAKALSVVFANDLTGITNANAAEEATQPAKRIVNGQLVIEKNGKRYNAAGAEF